MRIGLVLSAGGLRGAAHVGVLRALVRHRVPIDVIVGVSAGAIIAAYYAAVGLDIEELIGDAHTFRGRHCWRTASIRISTIGSRRCSMAGAA